MTTGAVHRAAVIEGNFCPGAGVVTIGALAGVMPSGLPVTGSAVNQASVVESHLVPVFCIVTI